MYLINSYSFPIKLQDKGRLDEVRDLEMRLLLYTVLSSEGGLQAQMVFIIHFLNSTLMKKIS